MASRPADEAAHRGGDCSIRRMTVDDCDAVREVARATWDDAYRDIIPELERAVSVERGYTREALERRLRSGTFLVAVRREEVVGFADFSPQTDEVVGLAALYVLPAVQGHGLGSRLLEEGIRRFPAARWVVLRVLTENAAARRFYEERGFREAGEYPWRLWSGGVVYELELVRELAVLA